MSDLSDDNYVTFGVPLEALDEENISRKKPVTIEDQYAYDAQGRRRFHGAFTGGFSAGYFNTVGTRDGWRPQQFKSSRNSKADTIVQQPEDFMDEEDTSLFGIAPKGIRATSDYVNYEQKGEKRKRISNNSNGPIPGTPVLQELLKPIKETVGIILLKKMGWKPGQGVGCRLTKKEKHRIKQRNKRLRTAQENPDMIASNSEESDDDLTNITFAPDDYEPFRCKPKDNYFGIGYSGLDRRKVLSSHINLFETPVFCVQDKNKKLSIRGQAFGVGAFEADDEDIYEREDMSHYDFTLGPEIKTKTRWSQDDPSSSQVIRDCLQDFVRVKDKLKSKKMFKPPELPKDFVPMHNVRKSRFYPPIATSSHVLQNGKRRELNALDRARILEDPEDRLKSQTSPKTSVAAQIITNTLNLHGKQQIEERKQLENQQTSCNTWLNKLNAQNFVKAGIQDDPNSLKKLEGLQECSSVSTQLNTEKLETINSKNETKKLFLFDSDKQKRFEQYLIFLKDNEQNKLESIQPLSMTDWEREHERTEFEQAAKLDQHNQISNDYLANKFVYNEESPLQKADPENDTKQAAKLKMFGKLTRQRVEWKPASIVCKRFNIPEPKVGCAQVVTDRKTAHFSVFDSLDWCNSSKFTKAVDAQAEEISQPSSKIKDAIETIPSTNTSNIPSNLNRTPKIVSEKFKDFEASYEKVFGRGVQETSTVTDIQQDEDHLKNKYEQIEEVKLNEENNQGIASIPPITFKNSEEKKDLFKAIFLSSSEDSDSELEEDVNTEAVKSILIGKDPKELNVQRNTSPPRGIFAKLDLDNLITQPNRNLPDESTVSKISDTNLSENQKSQDNLADISHDISEPTLPLEMYGPALPQRLLNQENISATDTDNSQLKPVFRSVVISKNTDDLNLNYKWVEREKLKKLKKEKKKHKHKEHKSSKHKKKSKKEKHSKH